MRGDVVLLADDDSVDIEIIRRSFAKGGLDSRIEEVANGVECIAYLSGETPYNDRQRYPLPVLLLLDVRMPLTDGFEVLRWIRSQPTFDSLKVVVLTGVERMGDASLAYQLGANSFLLKPFDFDNPNLLIESIRLLMKRKPD